MSTGRLGDFADDPNSVFVDVPPNPGWLTAIDVLLTVAAIAAAYLVARHLGAGRLVATIVAVLAAGLVGFKISVIARLRRVPRLDVAEFDAVRQAASRCLADFRQQHPDLTHVGWSLVASTAQDRVIRVQGNQGGQMIEASCTYTVAADGSLQRDPSPRQGSSYSQRIARDDCVGR